MRSSKNKIQLPKLAYLVSLGCASLSIPSTTLSDIYVWGELVGLASDPTTCAASSDAVGVTFTMVNPDGTILKNSDTATNAANGFQSDTCGTVTYNTETNRGSAEIVAFDFFGAGPAAAQAVDIDLIPSPQDLGIGNLWLGNMLFNWSVNIGIPVSVVWDAQGIIGEMDGIAASFTLADNDGGTNNAGSTTISITQTGSSPFAGVGAIPATDGNDTVEFAGLLIGELELGPQPMAVTRYNTTNVPACAVLDTGPDGAPGGGDDVADCMLVNPSADITAAIVTDSEPNPTATQVESPPPSIANPYPTGGPSTPGMGGNPMQDGPFAGFNANFDFNNFKLIGFTDTTPPLITLNPHVTPAGTSPLSLTLNVDTYTEPGATCTDAAPVGTVKASIIGGDTVDTSVGGIYTVTYDCADGTGNSATQVTRTVIVASAGAPLVALNGSDTVTHECGVSPYTDAGAICVDFEDGAITGTDAPLAGNLFSSDANTAVDTSLVGPNTVTWSCTDSNPTNNLTTLGRMVNVVDTTDPVVTLVPPATQAVLGSTLTNPQIYVDPDATATDSCDTVNIPIGNFSATSGSVNMNVSDTATVVPFTLTYTATDADGNSGSAVRDVQVSRAQPVITLLGPASLILGVGDTYIEQGMDVEDLQDGNLTAITTSGITAGTGAGANNLTHTVSGVVDTNTTGTYTITYDVTDNVGNPATTVTRSVLVGVFADASNFTMLDAQGRVFGGTNDVVFDWPAAAAVIGGDLSSLNASETDTKFNMGIASAGPHPFFGAPWFAHHIRVFGPGMYSFETNNAICSSSNDPKNPGADDIETTGCPGVAGQPNVMTLTVGAGQVGAHILFDYNGTFNIDVVNLWDISTGVWIDPDGSASTANDLWGGAAGLAPDPTTTWKLVSLDVDGDGFHGSPMLDGPFQDFYANFSAGPAATTAAPEPITGSTRDTKLGDDPSPLGSVSWGILLLPIISLFRRYLRRQ